MEQERVVVSEGSEGWEGRAFGDSYSESQKPLTASCWLVCVSDFSTKTPSKTTGTWHGHWNICMIFVLRLFATLSRLSCQFVVAKGTMGNLSKCTSGLASILTIRPLFLRENTGASVLRTVSCGRKKWRGPRSWRNRLMTLVYSGNTGQTDFISVSYLQSPPSPITKEALEV